DPGGLGALHERPTAFGVSEAQQFGGRKGLANLCGAAGMVNPGIRVPAALLAAVCPSVHRLPGAVGAFHLGQAVGGGSHGTRGEKCKGHEGTDYSHGDLLSWFQGKGTLYVGMLLLTIIWTDELSMAASKEAHRKTHLRKGPPSPCWGEP